LPCCDGAGNVQCSCCGGTGRVHLPTVQEDFAAGVGLADSKIVPELYNTEDAFYSGSATVPAPDAEYTVTTDQGYPNATQGSSVSFDGTTSLSAASFAWDFGDGSAHGTGSTTTHPYSCTAAPPCSFRSTLLINQGTATATNATKIIFVTAAAAVFNYGLAVTSPSPSTVTITAVEQLVFRSLSQPLCCLLQLRVLAWPCQVCLWASLRRL